VHVLEPIIFVCLLLVCFCSVCDDYDTTLQTQDRILKQISLSIRQHIYVHVDLQGFILMALKTFPVSC
jgi:hypothetical protein